MRIAVFGDIHGHWFDLRDAVLRLHGDAPLDLVLQCGDAQPIRDATDLEYLSCPPRHRQMGDYHRFHSGEEVFPLPVLFVGGNHEPWNYLDERGSGVLVPNIDFLGRVGLRTIQGLRVAGISGNFSPYGFTRPHLLVPYPPSDAKLATYYNQADIDAAIALGRVDILVMHNWPSLMNAARDLTWPAHWRSGVGCEHLSRVVAALSPRWGFCGHMHHRTQHTVGPTTIVGLPDFCRDPELACLVVEAVGERPIDGA